jgi:hypothetical protein
MAKKAIVKNVRKNRFFIKNKCTDLKNEKDDI